MTDANTYHTAIELALLVAESSDGTAGPNVARVLAEEVRRLRLVAHELGTSESKLQLRVAQSQTALAQIEVACERHGYNADDDGLPLSEWIDERLSEGGVP